MSTASQHQAALADLRKVAMHAMYAWQVRALADVQAMAVEHDATGPGVLVVMRATTNELEIEADPGEEVEWREALLSIDIAAPGTVRTLTRDNAPDRWADYVQVWNDVREVLQYTAGSEIPAGVVVDIDRDVVCTYDAFYCPDLGEPEAALVIDASEPLVSADDPFEALLSQSVAVPDPEERINVLLHNYGLSVPSVAAHDEGACGGDD